MSCLNPTCFIHIKLIILVILECHCLPEKAFASWELCFQFACMKVVLSEIQLSVGFAGSQLWPRHPSQATGTFLQLERCDKQGPKHCLYAGKEACRTSCSLRQEKMVLSMTHCLFTGSLKEQ